MGLTALPEVGVTEAFGQTKTKMLVILACRGYLTHVFREKFHRRSGVPMARVTVEDCIDKVNNRFDLVLLASHRARMVSSGSQITIERDNDKNPVVALREIAESTISPGDLKEDLIHSLQKYVEVDEPEPEAVPMIAGAAGKVEADDV